MNREYKDKLIDRLFELSDILRSIDLAPTWILAVIALSSQEIAIKKKLDEFGISCSESDFQELSKKLEQAYKDQKLDLPLILLSISRSYRHIRSKLLHEGHKYRVSEVEAESILYNTRALINELFVRSGTEFDNVQSIKFLTKAEIMNVLKDMPSDQLLIIMKKIFDEFCIISNWSEVEENKRLYDFVMYAIIERDADRINLFDLFLNSCFPAPSFYVQSKLLSVLAEIVKIKSIRNWILHKEYVDKIISELENSRTFHDGGLNTEMILPFLKYLTSEQLNQVIDASNSNNQIHFSYKAEPNLKMILGYCEGKVDEDKLKQLSKKIKQLE